MAKHQKVLAGQYVRAHRNNNDLHGFKSGQVVRVLEVADDGGVYAVGQLMGVAHSDGRFDWGRKESQTMWLYPGEYKLAKQRNRKEGV